MKKIIFYNGSVDFGGAERYLISVVNGFKARDYDVSLITIKTPYLKYYKEALKGIEIIETPRFFSFPVIFRAIRKIRPDTVFLNIAYPSTDLSAALAAKTARAARIVGSIHFAEPVTSRFPLGRQIKKLIAKILFPLLDKAIISSKKCKSQLVENYCVSPDKIAVVYNGIDIAPFSKAIADNEKQTRDKNVLVTIGMVGRVVNGKGHDVFIKAAAEVLSSGKDAGFLVVGDGPLLNKIKKIANDLNVSKNVIFSGYQENLFSFIAKMDVAVLPSLHETFPYVVLEYMAMSKPVIATDVGGVSEMIEEGTTGLVVPPGDSKALANAMIKLINDKGSSAKMGLNGRQRVEDNFTINKMIDYTMKAIGDPGS